MTAHPNRSRAAGPANNPSPDEIRAARAAAGLTQEQAAALVWRSRPWWLKCELPPDDPSHRRIEPAVWALFLLRTGQHPTSRLFGELAVG